MKNKKAGDMCLVGVTGVTKQAKSPLKSLFGTNSHEKEGFDLVYFPLWTGCKPQTVTQTVRLAV